LLVGAANLIHRTDAGAPTATKRHGDYPTTLDTGRYPVPSEIAELRKAVEDRAPSVSNPGHTSTRQREQLDSRDREVGEPVPRGFGREVDDGSVDLDEAHRKSAGEECPL
jgi:hypothetical protein